MRTVLALFAWLALVIALTFWALQTHTSKEDCTDGHCRSLYHKIAPHSSGYACEGNQCWDVGPEHAR
jgi:hypothetical protein